MNFFTGSNCIVVDVTLRDGGYVNGHTWASDEAISIVSAISDARVPFVEVGYLRSAPDMARPSYTCPDDYLAALASCAGSTGILVMIRPGEVDPRRIRRLPDLGVAGVRVLVRDTDGSEARPYLETASDVGLFTAANIIRVSEIEVGSLPGLAASVQAAGAQTVYLADSNGSLFPDAVAERITAVVDHIDVPVGLHPHDNLGLAFINTCAALDSGARVVDASLAGIGKGGGNLDIELIAAHLLATGGADLVLEPLAASKVAMPCRLRMLTEGRSLAVASALLDVNLDRVSDLSAEIAHSGVTHVLQRQSRAFTTA